MTVTWTRPLPYLRLLGLATAVAITQTLAPTPIAVADDPEVPTDVVVYQTPLTVEGSTDPLNQFTVTQIDGGTLTVSNPGNTAPTSSGCVPLSTSSSGTLCVGGSSTISVGGSDTVLEVIGLADMPNLQSVSLEPLVQEALVATSELFNISDPSVMAKYGRAEIRAYVIKRLQQITDKVLYGEPLTDTEQQVFDEFEAWAKAREVTMATATWQEYKRWESNPCHYSVPSPPPGSGLDAVPNTIANTTICKTRNGIGEAFRITDNTPSLATFQTWAMYRNPDAVTQAASDPRFAVMAQATITGFGMLGTIAAGIIAAGTAAIFATVFAASTTALTTIISTSVGAAASSAVVAAKFGLMVGNLAGAAGIIVAGLAFIALSSWVFGQDLETKQEIADFYHNAGGEDPFDIEFYKPLYVGLDFDSREDPADGIWLSSTHKQEFGDLTFRYVFESLATSTIGTLIKDPVTGYNAAWDPETDYAFRYVAQNGNPIPPAQQTTTGSVMVNAPEGTVTSAGNVTTGYRLYLSKGWLMLEPSVKATMQAARPELSLDYIDEFDQPARMAITTRYVDDEEITEFVLHRTVDGQSVDTFSDTWTFKTPSGMRTVSLVPPGGTLPSINVVPTADGMMTPGSIVTLRSNVSDPAFSVADATYEWTIDRYNDAGSVAESITLDEDNLVGFQERFDTPGAYRATITWRGTASGVAMTRSGYVDFTISSPVPAPADFDAAPELIQTDNTLSVLLRLTEEADHDTFDVAIDWAQDSEGNLVTTQHTVSCVSVGDGTCETGAVSAGSPGNPQWSAAPTHTLSDDEFVIPNVSVTVTNSYGSAWRSTFPVAGDTRPSWSQTSSSVKLPIGVFTRTTVAELNASQVLNPGESVTGMSISDQITTVQQSLPDGVQIELVESETDGVWELEIFGTPQTASMGPHTFALSATQYTDQGGNLRTVPTFVTVEVTPSAAPGWRAFVTGVPSAYVDRTIRDGYPDWYVAVGGYDEEGVSLAGDFTGTVHCQMKRFGALIVDTTCTPGEPFPWPDEIPGSWDVELIVWAESDTQPISSDGNYAVTARLKPLRVEIGLSGNKGKATKAKLSTTITDFGNDSPHITAPWPSGYQVTCRLDKAKSFSPCLATGSMKVLRTPGSHTARVRVSAPDGTVVTTTKKWTVTTPATTLRVKAPAKAKRGAKVTVKVTGLLPSEKATLTLRGTKVGQAKASSAGVATITFRVATGASLGKAKLVATGATGKRIGRSAIRITR